ncbi:hypothetical protein LY13_003951 [Prauserella aidingensis]|uniref:hypothetical protein n=1 Tax=Prauserella aidingensis TaxID=387890 RepID=UPI0020A4BF28|nr:hypothetical protein [Prauserella aidingensis]MCP2255177.1 hypothetical protein [Prauserella aidingensis]
MTNNDSSTRRWTGVLAVVGGILAAVGLIGGLIVLAGQDHSGGGTGVAAHIDADTSAASGAPETVPSGEPVPDSIVVVHCDVDGQPTRSESFTIADQDFTEAWDQGPSYCESFDAAPDTETERDAYEASGYADGDIGVLYSQCTEASAGSYPDVPSATQVSELEGILILCPDHPRAGKFRELVKAGNRDIELADSGRLIRSGTWRVGEQVQPGTYAVESHIEGCYWERTDSTGEIIDNNFVRGAKRVEATIVHGDHSFTSENCGTWRPVE